MFTDIAALSVPPAVHKSIPASCTLCAGVCMRQNALVLLVRADLSCSAVLQQGKLGVFMIIKPWPSVSSVISPGVTGRES